MKKADVWSLGLTFYCLAFNKLPFGFAKTDYR
jgi:serine/threonine protein kinase